jgi:hypothetical protein
MAACPDRTSANGPLRKSTRGGPTVNPPPPALSTAWDRKPISVMTGAAPDCSPQPGRTSPTLGWSVIAVKPSRRGDRQGGAAAELLTKNIKNVKTSFFETMSEAQKDSEDVSAGIGFFKLLINFSCYLGSKSAKSTLTSPGPIRVKLNN